MAKTWAEVEANPEYQALPPDQKEAARQQYFHDVVAPQVPKEDFDRARAQFELSTNKNLNGFQRAAFQNVAEGKPALGESPFSVAGDVARSLALGAPTSVAAGLAGGVTSAFGGGPDRAADVVRRVQSFAEPSTRGGQAVVDVLAYPFRKLGEGANVAGEKVADITGSPALGATTNAALQAIPMLIGGRTGASRVRALAGKEGAEQAAIEQAAEERAKSFVQGKTSLKWDTLSQSIKDQLANAAKDVKNFANLDPAAIERQIKLDKLDIPYLRGQLTRNLAERTQEQALSKSGSGQPIRDVYSAQDARLHGLLNELRAGAGAKAETRTAAGKSVQGALRSKLSEAKSRANDAYVLANKLGENELTTTGPLVDFLKDPINDANVGTDIRARLKSYASADGKITLKNLEDIRQELTRNAKNPNKGGHYASEAAKVIDKIMNESGSTAYKNARASWKGMKDEFDKQTRIKKLVTEKGMSTERATALEDTIDRIVRSPAEEIAKIKKSLLDTKGYSPEVAQAGAQAWKDIQGGVIEHLREKATGKRQIAGEKGTPQFNSTFRDTFNELDKDGKIDAIFDPHQAEQLRAINQAVETVRTDPSGRIQGSDTVPKLMAALDKIAQIPAVGPVVAGAVKLGKKAYESGKEGRQVREATTSTPLAEAAKASESAKPAPAYALNQPAAQAWPNDSIGMSAVRKFVNEKPDLRGHFLDILSPILAAGPEIPTGNDRDAINYVMKH